MPSRKQTNIVPDTPSYKVEGAYVKNLTDVTGAPVNERDKGMLELGMRAGPDWERPSGPGPSYIDPDIDLFPEVEYRVATPPKVETVDHPDHYNQGKIEVIDFIEDQDLEFSLGNAVKYICRAPWKGKYKEDLEKAIWYIQRELNRNVE